MNYSIRKILTSMVCLGAACLLLPSNVAEGYEWKHHWDKVSAYGELLSGVRRDDIKVEGNVPDVTVPYAIDNHDTAWFFQNNFKGGIRFFDLIYGRGELGYGVLVHDRNVLEESFITGQTISHSPVTYHDGHAWDWLAAGGFHLPFRYHKYCFIIEPEMGYTYKKVRFAHSSNVKLKGPFAGLRFEIDFGKRIGWNVFYNYLFKIQREQKGTFLNPNNNAPTLLPTVTGGNAHAYKIGSGIWYKPFQHWGFSLDWEMFHATANEVLAPFGLLNHIQEGLHVWWSNQLQLGVFCRY